MKIGLLTSTRADWGILTPLAKEIEADDFFDLEIIAFGTHFSEEFGYTVEEIKSHGFSVSHCLDTVPDSDSPEDISTSIGRTIEQFAGFWAKNKFDLIICLGDRYEMFAAVGAASPFNIPIAHIHAGETTLGAIDNAYRHSISLMSKYLFVSTEQYKLRASEICRESAEVFNVGALSVDNLLNYPLFSKSEFQECFGISLEKPTILSTFHPETVALQQNEIYIKELLDAFQELKKDFQIVITMPNSDTMGLVIRYEIEKFAKQYPDVKVVESFGMKGYLTCMKYCSLLLGNSSSGFVEAAFFPKWVINIGDRQNGRIITENILSSSVEKNSILAAVESIKGKPAPDNCNVYGNGDTATKIVEELKKIGQNGFE